MKLFDAHIHLTDAEYIPYLDHVVKGLEKMEICACSVTIDYATSVRSIDVFNAHRDTIRQFIGIHPEAAEREDIESFVQLFNDNLSQIDGVGEIGLDRTYVERGSSFERQKDVFLAMLELAERFQKPISIHSRRALDDILSILPSYRIKTCLLHWFAGSKKQLARCMDIDGLYVSFGPALVYADDKRVLLKCARQDRILIETDGPVRYSKCFAGLPAMSTSFLVSVLMEAARLLDKPFEETRIMLVENAEAYLVSQR